MNAIERIKALIETVPLTDEEYGYNKAIDKVLAILEEEKPVDPCLFLNFLIDELLVQCGPRYKLQTYEQLLEIYKQTLK